MTHAPSPFRCSTTSMRGGDARRRVHRRRRRARRASTLIETLTSLVVLVALAGVCSALLLEAQRHARLESDVDDMRAHAWMKEVFVTDWRGRMPNAPSDPLLPPGPPCPLDRFLDSDNPVNEIALDGGVDFKHLSKMYHLVVGEYATPLKDKTGADLLHPMFRSAGDERPFPVGDRWDALREKHDDSLTGFPRRGEVAQGSLLPDVGYEHDDTRSLLAGSYRYTLVAQTGMRRDKQERLWSPRRTDGDARARAAHPFLEDDWADYRAYVQSGDFVYPGLKIIFWGAFADHNRNATWYTDNVGAPEGEIRGADVAVCFHDGSAGALRPFEAMPASDVVDKDRHRWEHMEIGALEGGAQMNPGSPSFDAGRVLPPEWTFENTRGFTPGRDLAPISDAGAPDAPPRRSGLAWFLATRHGPEGYDVRNRTAEEREANR